MNRPIDIHGLQRNEQSLNRGDKPFEDMTEEYSHEKNMGKITDIQKKMHEIIDIARSLEQENDIQQGRKCAFIEDITKVQVDSLHKLRKSFEG